MYPRVLIFLTFKSGQSQIKFIAMRHLKQYKEMLIKQ